MQPSTQTQLCSTRLTRAGRPYSGWASLTPTESAVVDLVTEGLTNAGIAARLFVATPTVKCHLHHVFVKLGVVNRTQLAALATERRVS